MALHAKAKAEAGYRFYALYDKISRADNRGDHHDIDLSQGARGPVLSEKKSALAGTAAMNRIGRLVLWLSVVVASLASGQAWTQGFGDPGSGRALARQICSECHAIDRTQGASPNPAAPRFEVIANISGMTGAALSAVLQISHRTMPNVMLDADELSNIIAYILSLKRAD